MSLAGLLPAEGADDSTTAPIDRHHYKGNPMPCVNDESDAPPTPDVDARMHTQLTERGMQWVNLIFRGIVYETAPGHDF